MRGIVKGALLSGIILVVALAGCSQKVAEPDVKEAIAVLNPTEGSKVRGVVGFVKDGKGVRITANIEGLSPGPHGFHIHDPAFQRLAGHAHCRGRSVPGAHGATL